MVMLGIISLLLVVFVIIYMMYLESSVISIFYHIYKAKYFKLHSLLNIEHFQ